MPLKRLRSQRNLLLTPHITLRLERLQNFIRSRIDADDTHTNNVRLRLGRIK
jgi:hypothetical protein